MEEREIERNRRTPVCRARARLPLSPRASINKVVLFMSSRELFLFFVLARAFCSLYAQAQQLGSSSRPLEKNSHS